MLTPKFLRAHVANSGLVAGGGLRWLMKAMYEFWGFCINGGDDLKSAGGFAPVSGVYQMPWSGSADTSLISSGSDGYTQVGMPFFNTVNPMAFSASYVGLHLVLWRSGSASTDDSIYQIMQWINSSSVRVNVLEGGTPYSGSMHPAFTSRTNINYRLINFNHIASASMALTANTSSLVIQLNGAPLVNQGQRLSQVRIKYVFNEPGSPYPNGGGLAYTLSPSGTWHGPELSSGSFVSGSVVYAGGLKPISFLQASSVYFTGTYAELTGGVPSVSTGSTLVGNLTGYFTPVNNDISSASFVLPNGEPVLSGAYAQFSGTLDGIEGRYSLTGTLLPVASSDALNFVGIYDFSGSGVFTPSGVLLPPGFHSESINQYMAGSPNSSYWFNTETNAGAAYITLIGSTDFLILHFKATTQSACGFHIEIPQRLYPRSVDPNPICVMGYGNGGPYANFANYGYSGATAMHNPTDNTLMTYRGLTRRFFGNNDSNSPTNGSSGRYNGAYFNQYNNKFLFMDVILANATYGQYQMARTRLRRVRILAPVIPSFERIGNNGEWLYLHNSILWPWDNALLPYNLFLGGYG